MAKNEKENSEVSYSFDGANDNLLGTLTSTYNVPFTVAIKAKVTSFVANDLHVQISDADGSNNSSLKIVNGASANLHLGTCQASNGGSNGISIDTDVGTGWVNYIFVATSDVLRDFYIGSDSTTGQNTVERIMTELQVINLGEDAAGAGDFAGLLAEASFWNKALSAAERQQFYDNEPSSGIAAANLIAYYPLDTDGVLTNEGVDTGGDLTATGAVFSADHPTMVGGASRRPRRMGLMGVG